MKTWELIRDVLLTGTGIFLAIHEAYSAHPNDAVLAFAMGLVVPAAYGNVRALLSPPGASSSSRRSSEQESPQSSQQQEGSSEKPTS